MWTRDSKNKIIFHERTDKYQLFLSPENFLLSSTDLISDYDDHSRAMLLEEFFSASSHSVPELSGPLYLKSDSKKGWKKFHFVLRASGLYYYPKEKSKSSKDLVCLTSFDINEVRITGDTTPAADVSNILFLWPDLLSVHGKFQLYILMFSRCITASDGKRNSRLRVTSASR